MTKYQVIYFPGRRRRCRLLSTVRFHIINALPRATLSSSRPSVATPYRAAIVPAVGAWRVWLPPRQPGSLRGLAARWWRSASAAFGAGIGRLGPLVAVGAPPPIRIGHDEAGELGELLR